MPGVNNIIFDAIDRTKNGLSQIADIATQLGSLKKAVPSLPSLSQGSLSREQAEFLSAEINHAREYLEDIPKNPNKWHRAINELMEFRENARNLLKALTTDIHRLTTPTITRPAQRLAPVQGRVLAAAGAS